MEVTDEPVQSIDYMPVVDGPASAWGVKQRAVCGQLGGEQRAHNLNWLDTVSDMKTLQTKAKAAQLADLKDDGRLKATASKLLVGTNIAVETNNANVRRGLYQLQFLYLNCETGFTAPPLLLPAGEGPGRGLRPDQLRAPELTHGRHLRQPTSTCHKINYQTGLRP